MINHLFLRSSKNMIRFHILIYKEYVVFMDFSFQVYCYTGLPPTADPECFTSFKMKIRPNFFPFQKIVSAESTLDLALGLSASSSSSVSSLRCRNKVLSSYSLSAALTTRAKSLNKRNYVESRIV